MLQPKMFFLLGSLFAFIAVAAGAFGAHALRQKLNADLLSIFEVGVRYQMYHALALLCVGFANGMFPHPLISVAGWLFVAGIIIFSGSLYLLALSGIRTWGAITPIGGTLMLIGWLCLIIATLKNG